MRHSASCHAPGEVTGKLSKRRKASNEVLIDSPFDNLAQVLVLHQQWRQSKKKQGVKADLHYRRITSLAGLDLSEADLRDANLSGANLCNANFWRANLGQANLSKADLRGAILREANLQGADLTDVTGLLPGQLAGADVANARLPTESRIFAALDNVKEISDSAQKVFLAMLAGCVYCWLTLATTSDVRLLTNSASSPLPITQTPIPILYFFWVAPMLLFCVYGYLLLYLQRLWDGLTELPAVFPDGRTLHQRASSWLLNGLVSIHMFQLKNRRPPFTRFQAWITVFLAWGMVPVTGLLFLIRYLPTRDALGISFHIFMLGISIGWGMTWYLQARMTLQGRQIRWYKQGIGVCALAIGLCTGLFFIAFTGMKPTCLNISRRSTPKEIVNETIKVLIFTANFIEADVSTKPPNWTEKKEEIALVKGALLKGANLQCARAIRAFLVNADLRSTDLSSARLQDANLQGANFEGAILSGANLQGANLQDAKALTETQVKTALNAPLALYSPALLATLGLPSDHNKRIEEKNLQQYNLQGARLIRANFERVNLQDADLQRADLRQANFQQANLQQANLQAANLRQANLQQANLRQANLQQANLQQANLQVADLYGVQLQGADLTGAQLQGARLNQAQLQDINLQQANLQDADLSSVRGLTQRQVNMTCVNENTQLPQGLISPAPCPTHP
jgi:uncharacterized protein YjbI with pentapeptide repeats